VHSIEIREKVQECYKADNDEREEKGAEKQIMSAQWKKI
jgi:hypothetical protein